MSEEINKLYVGNLSYDLTDETLSALFTEAGLEVVEAKVITDRETGNSKGFAFVTVATPEMAQKAIAEMNGKEVAGRALTVNMARPREERPNSGSRGGSWGGNNRGGYGRR
jgi:cold-inducible RNA-binding protein